jgi:hypothetical protein
MSIIWPLLAESIFFMHMYKRQEQLMQEQRSQLKAPMTTNYTPDQPN